MIKRSLTVIVVLVFVVTVCSLVLAAEKKKVKGMIAVHPDKKDMKVIADDFSYDVIYYNKKTKVEATVKAKISDFEKEMKQSRLPKGTVTYIIKDGKKIATKVSFKSRASWGIKKKRNNKSHPCIIIL
jgi:hypothetical protein